MPQNLNDFSLWIPTFITIICQKNNYFMSIHGPFRGFFWNKYISGKPVIIWNHKSIILALLINTYQLSSSAGQDLLHRTFSPLTTLPRLYHDLHHILMKCSMYFLFRNKNIIFHSFYSYKAKASCMCSEDPRQKLTFTKTVLSFCRDLYLTLQHQFIQHFL